MNNVSRELLLNAMLQMYKEHSDELGNLSHDNSCAICRYFNDETMTDIIEELQAGDKAFKELQIGDKAIKALEEINNFDHPWCIAPQDLKHIAQKALIEINVIRHIKL